MYEFSNIFQFKYIDADASIPFSMNVYREVIWNDGSFYEAVYFDLEKGKFTLYTTYESDPIEYMLQL